MQKFEFILRLFISIILVFLIAACDTSSTTQAMSDFDKLCKIYEETVDDQSSQTKKVMLLTEKIKKEIPSIYVLYQNAALVDKQDKYQFYKEAAVKATNRQWDCEAMKLDFSSLD